MRGDQGVLGTDPLGDPNGLLRLLQCFSVLTGHVQDVGDVHIGDGHAVRIIQLLAGLQRGLGVAQGFLQVSDAADRRSPGYCKRRRCRACPRSVPEARGPSACSATLRGDRPVGGGRSDVVIVLSQPVLVARALVDRHGGEVVAQGTGEVTFLASSHSPVVHGACHVALPSAHPVQPQALGEVPPGLRVIAQLERDLPEDVVRVRLRVARSRCGSRAPSYCPHKPWPPRTRPRRRAPSSGRITQRRACVSGNGPASTVRRESINGFALRVGSALGQKRSEKDTGDERSHR